jgi:sec-independent protein translocase protein TatC
MTKRVTKATRRAAKTDQRTDKLPIIEHIRELRRRLIYVAVCVAIGGVAAYTVQQRIISLLLRPSHGQSFIYTSPLGGINFLFGVCIDFGFIVATPLVIYQFLAFLHPLMRSTTHRFLLTSSAAAGVVAIIGVLFGYYIGLPSALKFLLHQFTSIQIRPLITIQSYMQFVSLYLLGSALMFQLPLVLIIINRIKPLRPQHLFKYERHLIATAFIVAFIMNPTPNILGQMVVVVPIILMYQLGIALVWFLNRGRSDPLWLQQLLDEDAKRQEERANRALVPFFATQLPHTTEVNQTIDTNQSTAATQ